MKEVLLILIQVFIGREGSPTQRMDGKLVKIGVINSSGQHEEAVKEMAKREAVEKMFYLK